MRIQHNIMAMNAYRNYNTNTSALSKNLEKLSSGYKINRAGDDAAGLAISEKMRAQITGLNTAQKNVKDGISLVKTAEGAMQEVQDMLNRMVDLATQSANGTYQDAVDREALQAEIDQLNSEINRIADSANFNGIKLLDGSLDKESVTGVSYTSKTADEIMKLFPADMDGTQQKDLDGKGALETDGDVAPSKAGFEISLDGIKTVNVGKGEAFNLKIGATDVLSTKVIDAKNDVELSGSKLAEMLVDKNSGKATIGGVEYTVTAKDGVLKFTTEDKDVSLKDSATVTWEVGAAPAGNALANHAGEALLAATKAEITSVAGKDEVQADPGEKATGSIALGTVITAFNAAVDAEVSGGTLGDGTYVAGGKTYYWGTKPTGQDVVEENLVQISGTEAADVKTNFKAALKAAIPNGWSGDWNADTDTTLDLEATAVGDKSEAKPSVAGVEGTLSKNGKDKVDAAQATSATVTVGFDGATGADVIGSTVTVDGKIYEFAKQDGTVTQGNIRVDIAEDANATAIADALATAMNVEGNKGTNVGTVTASSGVVTVTAKTPGAATTLTATSAVAGGGDGDKKPDLKTDVSSGEVLANDIDFTKATLETKKLDSTAMAAITGSIVVNDTTTPTDKVVDINLATIKDKMTEDTSSVKDLVTAILTEAQKQVDTWNAAKSADAGYKYGNLRVVDGQGNVLAGYEGKEDPTALINALAQGDGIKVQMDQLPLNDGASAGKTGYINTGLQNVTEYNAGSSAQLAHVAIDLDKANAWTDGAKITLGDTTYTVALGKDSKFKGVKNVIDLTGMEVGGVDKLVAAEKLTEAAAGNKIFTVGHDGKGNTTLQQRSSVKDSTDMTTKEKLASYLGVSIADSTDSAVAGKGLTLQIGDTSESFNQLNVSIGDIHADALGVGGLSVATQADAANAIDKIKTAINTVSSIRGTLGATQNRLEHTQNNLSVMAENIQDAESSIRDTDIAEEMMAYTKNNILVQSAQAMLAQANQVPQGVLQLLG